MTLGETIKRCGISEKVIAVILAALMMGLVGCGTVEKSVVTTTGLAGRLCTITDPYTGVQYVYVAGYPESLTVRYGSDGEVMIEGEAL